MNRYQTINTFSRRPVCTQIVAYLIYIAECITFFLCLYPNFNNLNTRTVILVLYIVTAIIQTVISIVCSYVDPSDSTMVQFRNNRSNAIDLKDCLYCDICHSYVKNSSRHCRQCQRCVEGFDHHCIWINNCIGQKNYRLFLGMIISTFVNMTTYLVGVGVLWAQNMWQQYLAGMIVLWICSVVIIVFSFLLLNLIVLHIYLMYKGLTTYQFIMLERQQQKKQSLQMQNKKRSQQIRDQNQVTIIPVKEKDDKDKQTINNYIKEKGKNKKQQTQNIIFGNYISQSHNTDKESENAISENQENKGSNQLNQDNDDNSLSSKNASSVNLSQFFTRNKSLKFLVGDQIGQRPKTSKISNQQSNHTSLKMIGKNQNQFQNARQRQKRKELQYSTQNNKKNPKLENQMTSINPLKIYPKK